MRIIIFLCLCAVSGAVLAQSDLSCSGTDTNCDEGVAYQLCMLGAGRVKGFNYRCEGTYHSHGGYFQSHYDTDSVQNANWGYYYFVDRCSSRPQHEGSTEDPAGIQSGCYAGCEYDSGHSDSLESIQLGNGPLFHYFVGQRPTGKTCDASKPGSSSARKTDEDHCQTSGSLTQCVSSNGQHCATSARGNKYCWGVKESGSQTSPDHNEVAIKSPSDVSISAPSSPPADGGKWQVTAQDHLSTKDNGGASTDYSVTTLSSTGSSSSQSHHAGQGDGGGTGSSGNGNASQGGGQDGQGDGGQDDSSNAGSGAAMGHLYTKSGKTMESVISAFKAQVSSTELVSSIKGFMSVPGGGVCPVFTLPATAYWDTLTLDIQCSSAFQALLRACGAVILAIASYCAIRIAVT